jgi:hypothetical protein
MFRITAKPAKLMAPAMVPVEGTHQAQPAERHNQFLVQFLVAARSRVRGPVPESF